MTIEDIIRMAREAGAAPYTNRHYPDRTTHTFSPNQLEAFAALVAAAEREECAKVIDDFGPTLANGAMLAEAIRARGQA